MATAPLSNLLLSSNLWKGAYQNDQGQWVTDVTSNEGVTSQLSLQGQMGPDQWQQFQNELSQGYFSPTTSPNGQSGLTLNTNLLPKVMGVIGLNPDLQNAGGGFASLGSNSSSPITQNMINKNAMSWDPNYGWVTSQANIKTPENFFEKAGNFVGDIAPYAIMAAMSAGFGGLNPEAFGSLFSSLPKIAQGVDQGGAQGGAAAALPQLLNVLRNW